MIGLAAGAVLLVAGAVVWALQPGAAAPVLIGAAMGALGYALGLHAMRRLPRPLPRGAVVVAVAAAIAARAVLLPAAPVLEDDVYRYLWDGAVVAAGHSPYRYSPQQIYDRRIGRAVTGDEHAEPLEALSRAPSLERAFLRINYPSVRTIYPPAAQLLFAATAVAAPGSVAGMKLALAMLDLFAAALLVAVLRKLGQPRRWALVYAWSPLVILSFAGAAHMDALPIAAVTGTVAALAAGRRGLGGALFGVAIGSKLFPLVAFPALRRQLGARGAIAAALVAAALYAPVLLDPHAFEGLATYAGTWRVNSAGFAVVAALLPDGAARVACALIVLAIALVAARGAGTLAASVRAAAIALTALVLFAPAVNPWYVAWLVPFAAIVRHPALAVLTVTCLGYYARFLPGGPPAGLAWLQYGPPLVVALAAALVARRSRPADGGAA